MIIGGGKMSFYNEASSILQDHLGNIHKFSYKDEKIIYYYFQKSLGTVEKKVILENASDEFDAVIDISGNIYLACKTEKEGIVLLSSQKDFSYDQRLVAPQQHITNLNLLLLEDSIHIFYCQSMDHKPVYKMFHCNNNHQAWSMKEIYSATKGQILNPIQPLAKEESILLGYYDLVEGKEQLFIKIYNKKTDRWTEGIQITHSPQSKLYSDILLLEKEQLHIAYCEYIENNLIVKYEKHILEGERFKKVSEQEISNLANCQYPTLVSYGDEIWLCWTEYNYIASRYSENGGKNWSEIYLWKESKAEDIIRYKYCTNQKTSTQLNYSFGRADNLQFVGFGSLGDTSKIPLKRRNILRDDPKKEVQEKNYQQEKQQKQDREKIKQRIQILKSTIEELQRKNEEEQEKTTDQIKELEDRMKIVEEFLVKNTRGFKYMKKK